MERPTYAEWIGCYRQSWTKGDIVEEAYSHPAKYAKGLIFRILEHLLAAGYVTKGQTILDPFGGVALGALPAMSHGLQWVGCELEPRFVELGHQNLNLWRNRFGFCGATLLQDDSRQLRSVLQAAGYGTVAATVTSPPYQDQVIRKRDIGNHEPNRQGSMAHGGHSCDAYGTTPGNLGNMKPGALVTSPPFLGARSGTTASTETKGGGPCADRVHTVADGDRLGQTPGNLAAMPVGIQSLVTSPPFSPPGNQPSGYRQHIRQDYVEGKTKADSPLSFYGATVGQLAAMPMGEALVTSPPFGKSTQVNNAPGDMTAGPATWNGGTDAAARVKQDYAPYAESPGNLGQLDADTVTASPETFWTAAAQILAEAFVILVPGAVAVFVLKDYVRGGKIVRFCDEWRRCCESVGFVFLEEIHALLSEQHGTQTNLFGADEAVETRRVSFFRMLAEKNFGSPKIDHETVLIMQKPVMATVEEEP